MAQHSVILAGGARDVLVHYRGFFCIFYLFQRYNFLWHVSLCKEEYLVSICEVPDEIFSYLGTENMSVSKRTQCLLLEIQKAMTTMRYKRHWYCQTNLMKGNMERLCRGTGKTSILRDSYSWQWWQGYRVETYLLVKLNIVLGYN